jgi:hypothetical protein
MLLLIGLYSILSEHRGILNQMNGRETEGSFTSSRRRSLSGDQRLPIDPTEATARWIDALMSSSNLSA